MLNTAVYRRQSIGPQHHLYKEKKKVFTWP